MTVQLFNEDCIEAMKRLETASVDAVITDPPYGLSEHRPNEVIECLQAWLAGREYKPRKTGFMGRSWDAWVPGPEVWKECLRVLKPGGHLLAFAGTRSMDLMMMAVRLAGFELRDAIGHAHTGDPDQAALMAWVSGQGFPKSRDVAKAIDAEAVGCGRPEDIRRMRMGGDYEPSGRGRVNYDHGGGSAMDDRPDENYDPRTDAAKAWKGWGTALKPAWEPIILARKPLEGTVAATVQKYGTGALNIDGCRVGSDTINSRHTAMLAHGGQNARPWHEGHGSTTTKHTGRWPANLIHDGSEEVVALFPAEAGAAAPVHTRNGDKFLTAYGSFGGNIDEAGSTFHGDTGSAARFFYAAKASKRDRNEGLEGAPDAVLARSTQAIADAARGITIESGAGAFNKARIVKNNHPTVKPTSLMRYLCRLVTPPGGVVLDCFMGSGSTGKAAVLEGFNFIGIDADTDQGYFEIASRRIADAAGETYPEGENTPSDPGAAAGPSLGPPDSAQIGLWEAA